MSFWNQEFGTVKIYGWTIAAVVGVAVVITGLVFLALV